jgi:hypothetical protein
MHTVTTCAARGRLAIAAALVALAGCGAPLGVTLQVQHPSPLARYGRRIAIEPLGADEGPRIGQRLTERVRGSNAFELTTRENAQMVLIGEVTGDTFGDEQTGERPYTCHRQVPELRTRRVPVVVEDPPPANGASNGTGYGGSTYQNTYVPRRTHIEYRTEQYTEMVDQPYACTQLLRWVEARFSVVLRVNARTRPIHTVWERTIELPGREEHTGIAGSDASDHEPDAVSGADLLEELRERAAEAAATSLLPRTESRAVELARVNDPGFDAAIALARAGDVEGAERRIDPVCTRLATPRSDGERAQLAACLFDRGVFRGFSGRVDEGLADLARAIELAPNETSWGAELATVRALAQEIEAARWRGETPANPEQLTNAPSRPPPRRGRPARQR